MKILFYDFETTGLPLFDQPSDDPRQPHIVQAAAALVDSGTRKIITSINLIADPDAEVGGMSWTIPDEVAAIHGITTDHAKVFGIPEDIIVNLLWRMWIVSDFRVAHNESFDARIMRIGMKRYGTGDPDAWKAGQAACTGKLATPIMGLKHKNRPKMPKLLEAYPHFCGKPLEGAHSAWEDMMACMEVYFAISGQSPPSDTPPEPTGISAPLANDDIEDGVAFL